MDLPGIGQTGALGIIVREHDPSQIKCWPHGTVPVQHYPEEGCSQFLAKLVADVAPLITWANRRCALRIFGGSEDVVDFMTYYNMWLAANALAGTNHKLAMQLDDGHGLPGSNSNDAPMANEMADSTNESEWDQPFDIYQFPYFEIIVQHPQSVLSNVPAVLISFGRKTVAASKLSEQKMAAGQSGGDSPVIEGRKGAAITGKEDQLLKITNTHGKQVIDLFAFAPDSLLTPFFTQPELPLLTAHPFRQHGLVLETGE
ncbi:MAG: hypothetical protein Q9221_001174 [Calogaya cf. arnoldii]